MSGYLNPESLDARTIRLVMHILESLDLPAVDAGRLAAAVDAEIARRHLVAADEPLELDDDITLDEMLDLASSWMAAVEGV